MNANVQNLINEAFKAVAFSEQEKKYLTILFETVYLLGENDGRLKELAKMKGAINGK